MPIGRIGPNPQRARTRGANARESDKTKVAASIHLDRPGAYTKRGARQIADWLRSQAEWIERDFAKMDDRGPVRCRYHVPA